MPALGVVRAGADQSFVIADIPGLIEGAADGAGLGVRFLKHIARTRLLLHVVDAQPVDEVTPWDAVRLVEHELANYSEGLLALPRWIVLNKCDLLPDDEIRGLVNRVRRRFRWQRQVFAVSAVTGVGTVALMQAVAEALREMGSGAPEVARVIAEDVLKHTFGERLLVPADAAAAEPDEDEDDEEGDDEDGVVVVYQH